MAKVLLLGLDGATFDYMDPWLASGRLPHLGRLIERGTRGVLRSTYLPVTALAWPSMLTGKNPGKHGIFDFTVRRPGTYELRPIAFEACRAVPLHRYLSRLGYRVGLVNVPLTYPPEPVNGIMIGGFLTPERSCDWAWPPALPEELEQAGAPYPMPVLHRLMRMERQFRAAPEIDTFIDLWAQHTEMKVHAIRHLLNAGSYDFFMVVFSGTDHINHHTPDLDNIRRIYEQVDAAVGRILELLDEHTAVVVASDHGSGPLDRYLILNRLLADLGLLVYRKEIAARYVELAGQRVTWRYRRSFARAWKRLPAAVRRVVSWPLLEFDRRLAHDFATIDWTRTRAYARSGIGALYVNLAGREPHGIVQRGAEYESVRDRLIDSLLTLRDPDSGEPLVAEALRAETVFHGAHMEDAPDVVFSFRDRRCRAMPGFASDPVIRPANMRRHGYREFGYHTPEGVLIAAGPGMRSTSKIASASIYDIAPTVLHLMGLPVPSDMDGRVLDELFERPPLVQPGPSWDEGETAASSGYAAAEQADVEERLRALGYLD
jgi:predicted AlkP superfamily phosphohydrolase/phosphomutase